MRKFLLVLMLAPLGLFAQNGSDVAVHHPTGMKGTPDNTIPKIPVSRLAAKTQVSGPSFFILSPTDTFSMGVTFYDLQTNGSDARRIVAYPDGSISAVWTTAPKLSEATDANPFTTRGTGYNHYNNTSWVYSAGMVTPLAEPTNLHTGWPNPCLDTVSGTTAEFCISHAPNGVITGINYSTLQRVDNTYIGGTDWKSKTVNAPEIDGNSNSPLWPRVAQSGKYAYMIANADGAESPGDTPEIGGIKDPTVYYRSIDGGTTWSSPIVLPGDDTSGNISYSGQYGFSDDYAIDAQDSTVAILLGGYFNDVALYKSSDYGKTFKKTIIDTFQIRYNHKHSKGQPPYFSYPKEDTAWHYTNDGSVNVILDKNDNAHVFYGTRYIKTSGGGGPYYDSVYTFNDYANGIMHWDEKNGVKAIIGGVPTLNPNYDITTVGTAFRVASGGSYAWEYGADGLTTMPTSAIDPNGNIYCVFSVYMETVDTNLGNDAELDIFSSQDPGVWQSYLHYRDLFITYSTDGGNTWATEQNITKTPNQEEVFGCLARNTTNGKLHLEYMRDNSASNYVGGVTTKYSNEQSLADSNFMMYMGINISDVLAGNFGNPANYESIMPIESNPLFAVTGLYPNPTEKGNVTVALTMNQAGPAGLQVYDITGNLMFSQDLGMVNPGKQIENINTKGLSAGMYIVKINAGGYSTMSKLVVE